MALRIHNNLTSPCVSSQGLALGRPILLEVIMEEVKHRLSSYSNGKCRCNICRKAFMDYIREYVKTPRGIAARIKGNKKHNAKRFLSPLGKLKRKACSTINNAILMGKITREPCLICGNGPTQAHHWHGYSVKHHGDVIWLCRNHHVD